MKKIIIFGGAGTSINIAEQMEDAAKNYGLKVELLGFANDDESLGGYINDYPVLCKTSEVKDKYDHKDIGYIFSMYNIKKMKERIDLLNNFQIEKEKFYTFIHPSVYVSKTAKIGKGTVILSNSTIQNNVVIGDFNIINSNVVVEHNTCIQDYNFIAACSCIGANVIVGKGCFFGLHSSIREHIKIENYAVVGMASNVIKNIKQNEIHCGNPAIFKRVID
jgi:sugar O-acyltransferase (sialic acid O-acetyltransferase NeuD family)